MRTLIVLTLAAVAVADIRFAVHGDWGDSGSSGQQRQHYVAATMDEWCTQQACDFIMSTGDNFYPDGAEAVDDERFNYNWRDVYTGPAINDLVHYITIGNHDHIDNNEIYQLEFAKNEDRFYFPSWWYDFTMEDDGFSALFFAMDTEAMRKNKYDPAAQRADMAASLSSSNADWKFVFGHHPPLSVGRYAGSGTILNGVVPICEDNNVDVIFTGHDHNLQHIQKIGDVDIDYIVSGGGGRSLYEYDSANEDIIRGYGFQPIYFGYMNGFVGITVTANEMKAEFIGYNVQGNDVSMEKVYEFSRYKN